MLTPHTSASEAPPPVDAQPPPACSLRELGIVLTDVMTYLRVTDLVEFLATNAEVHQWYDTCVEFRMAVAYTDAPWYDPERVRYENETTAAVVNTADTAYDTKGGSAAAAPNLLFEGDATYFESIRNKIKAATDAHNFITDAERALWPRTRPRWDFAPINFEQENAGYLEDCELPITQRVSMCLIPEVSYFNLRSLCFSSMVVRSDTGYRKDMPHLLPPSRDPQLSMLCDLRSEDHYDASVFASHAGDLLLAGLVAKHVVIKSTGGIASIGHSFLKSTTAITVTIAADRFRGSLCVAPASIGHQWLGDCRRLRSLDCHGLDAVVSVGNRWLERNYALESVSFKGLRSLATVGESWLNDCRCLTHVDFSGLNNLKEVGGWWMRHCSALTELDLKGLSLLREVGPRWLDGCYRLGTVHNVEVLPSKSFIKLHFEKVTIDKSAEEEHTKAEREGEGAGAGEKSAAASCHSQPSSASAHSNSTLSLWPFHSSPYRYVKKGVAPPPPRPIPQVRDDGNGGRRRKVGPPCSVQ